MKRSPHHNKHAKKKAIRNANEILTLHGGTEELERKWPYHIEQQPPKKPKKPKKQAKNASPSEVHERTEPAVVQHESPKWTQVTQTKIREDTTRINKKINNHKIKESH